MRVGVVQRGGLELDIDATRDAWHTFLEGYESRVAHAAALLYADHADVVLAPVPELPVRRLPVPAVVVVHDVGPLVAPAFYTRGKRLRDTEAGAMNMRLVSLRDGRAVGASLIAGAANDLRTWRQP